jgi:hypothetical protein
MYLTISTKDSPGTDLGYLLHKRRGSYIPLRFPLMGGAFRLYFRLADHPPGISVSLQVEHKQFIGNGYLIGSLLR